MSLCRTGLLAFLTLVSLWAVVGCAGTASHESDAFFATPATTAETRQPESYRLRVGDRLGVIFLTDQTLSFDALISPTGTIALPSGDEIPAAGLTVGEVRQSVQDRMSEFLLDSTASVTITELAEQLVYVLGEVKTPGAIMMPNGRISVGMAIAQAGGLLSTGRPSSVMVVRSTGLEEPAALRVDVTKLLSSRDLSQDVELQPYDIVYVPKSVIGKVDEFVDLFFNRIAPAQLFYLRGYDIVNRKPYQSYE
jgi:protein involved in polysaccharide export with SLBB domain